MKAVILSFTNKDYETYLNLDKSNNLKKKLLTELKISNLNVDIFFKPHYTNNAFNFLTLIKQNNERDVLFVIHYKNKENLIKRFKKIVKYSYKRATVNSKPIVISNYKNTDTSIRPHDIMIKSQKMHGIIPWFIKSKDINTDNNLIINHSSINIGSNFKGSKEQKELLLKMKERKSSYASLNKHNYARDGI